MKLFPVSSGHHGPAFSAAAFYLQGGMPKRRSIALQQEVLRVASDCSGLNGAALALESLNLPFTEEWVSDVEDSARKVLRANFACKRIYEDVRTPAPRDIEVDFYSAGYPCQAYSQLGKKQGMACENGKVLLYVLMRICVVKPRIFLLENVKNFQQFQKEFDLTMRVLKSIKDF